MTERPGFGALAGAGIAIGGTGVWGLAAAARVGVLRLLLELFPRPTWDSVTWGLIPALMLAPPVVQGVLVALLAGRRPAPIVLGAAGSVAGTGIMAGLVGIAVLVWVRRLPPQTVAALARGTPEALVPAFGMLVLAGWLLIAGRLRHLRWLRRGAVPLAVAFVALAWLRAHGQLMALSYVLDRPEVNGFFVSVALGGAVGSAWAVRTGRRAAPAEAG